MAKLARRAFVSVALGSYIPDMSIEKCLNVKVAFLFNGGVNPRGRRILRERDSFSESSSQLADAHPQLLRFDDQAKKCDSILKVSIDAEG